MTPILILLFGTPYPATTSGTLDLLYAAATKTVGSVVHGFNRTIEWRVVRPLAQRARADNRTDDLCLEPHRHQ